MSSLFLALTLYPEVQKRAQAELDSVISRDRLPTFEDKPRLPYIEAMCKELLRWQMVTPLGNNISSPLTRSEGSQSLRKGVPHASVEYDVYRGFFIPKGLICRAYVCEAPC
jgi:cytochrome P450